MVQVRKFGQTNYPSSFNIVDEKTGFIDKKIEIQANNFMINSKDLILISSANKKIFCFYLNGEKFYESDFQRFTNNLKAFIDSSDYIGFYNEQNLLFSYYN